MSTKPLEIKNYLSEKLELLSELLNKGEDTLLVSPTDSGKTRAIITYAKQNPQRRIAILCPTQALVDNLKQDCDIPAGYGKKWAQNTQFFNLLVTTYDSIQFFDKNWFETIIIDEAHYIAQAGKYRAKSLLYLLNLDCQKILVTATPKVIERLDNYKLIKVEKKLRIKEVLVYNQLDSEIRIAATIIKNRNKNKLLIIRINNKEILDKIQDLFPDIKITKLYSDKEVVILEGQDEKLYKEAKRGVISKTTEVLLATSIIDAGISLEVNRDVDCYAISRDMLINPIDAVQLSSRVRSHSGRQMNLHIIGRFGDYEEIEYPINNVKGIQQLELMAEEYDSLAKLNLYDYINLLGSYGISVYEKEPLNNLYVVSQKNARSNKEIVENFNSSKFYQKIKDRLTVAGFTNWTSSITGKSDFNFKDNSTHTRVYQYLIDAIDNNIHFDLILSDKFYEKKLSQFVFCNTHFNSEKSLEYNEIVNTIIDGYNNQIELRFNLDCFSRFDKQEKESIKQLCKLLYNTSKNWKSKTKLLKPKSIDEKVILYLTNFSYIGLEKN